MAKQIFRKVALDRLSSPEQLDMLIRITSPKGWLALAGVGLLIVVAIFWGIYGTIPTKVNGSGILLKSGGVSTIETQAQGKVEAVYLDSGDAVVEGQIVAKISQSELLKEISLKKSELSNMREQYENFRENKQKELELELKSAGQRSEKLRALIIQADKKIDWLQLKLSNNKDLYESGLVTRSALVQIEQEILNEKNNIKEYKNELTKLELAIEQKKDEYSEKAADYKSSISQTERTIAEMERELAANSEVLSPYDGRVTEVTAEENDIVNRGSQIMIIEPDSGAPGSLTSIMYVSALDGEKVNPGMEIQISPANVSQEEYGFLMGVVTKVSDFPATGKGIMMKLRNEDLVKALTSKGPPVEVQVALIPSSETYSGYKWSTRKGPPIKIHSGTVCYSKITVKEQPPITLVIPLLKKYLLGTGA